MIIANRFALILILSVNAALVTTGCKTVSSHSDTLYANDATTLAEIKKNTCVDFVKVDNCLLRLQGYRADQTRIDAFKSQMPKYYKILTDYGTDFQDATDPSVLHILESAKKAKLNEPELVALTTYMGPEFSNINSALRGNSEKWQETEHLIYSAASALTYLKPMTFKGKVFRSETTKDSRLSKLLDIYQVGNTVLEQPFLSTTTNENLRFAESDIGHGQILLRYTIESKTGVAVSDFSPTKSEDEILFAPGAVFKVTSFSRTVEDIVTDEEAKTIFKAETLNIGLEEIESI